ncbi:tyrosine-type recombinase/integrase [Elizabethkingia anophelis]|uniref:tyrosine-type recombinase/integrase n=1 Tax=Elizabethkingia anophelis TaxID=1117645 RepID=UPI001623F0A0|nr:phage integrase SAM-like domain-containing protein [Elizabethkingia anophelis]MCT3630969.1 tyrosine-type recombinase/integrase [Elizabethkingia anophelis]MCT3634484.1 tyrosine-type recombinase/integrase [Elizabethkingia anophelis]MCT3831210.1 tyrosine-type recombinase/integrase [Elizabethkingia anophelis]MCT3884688.1 tyrosine-type recombinase/integrase [Elizabethkingia anophelis]MCT3895455.1 tyrosine-type recombinase/integrase [Elizabethkingia anophelis]
MKINFRVKNTNKNPSSLYIRFFDSRNNVRTDIEIRTGFNINPNDWNVKKQVFKPNANRASNIIIGEKLVQLKEDIIFQVNLEYNNGGSIDKQFLKNLIDKFNNRPSKELGDKDPAVYFKYTIGEYVNYYSTHIHPDTKGFLKPNTIKKYETLKRAIDDFEKECNQALKLIDLDMDFHSNFIIYHQSKNHSDSTINKDFKMIKAILRFAENKQKYRVNASYKDKDFTFNESQSFDTYLNYDEIEQLTALELKDDRLDRFRDFFVCNLWFGCRVSDMQNISSANIENGNTVLIPEMKKVGKKVKIPIHKSVLNILRKRNGRFPFEDTKLNTSFEVTYNKLIKEICRMAGITEKIYGAKRKGENGTNVLNYYEKCDLITTKTCRKSFATNLYTSGKLSKESIMAITGHSDIKSFNAYVVDTANDNLEKVRDYFDNNF